MTEDMPVGLAAAAREVAHPKYKVSALQRAIEDGRLEVTVDPFMLGRRLVTVAAVRALIAADEAGEPAAPPVEQPETPKRRPKIKRAPKA